MSTDAPSPDLVVGYLGPAGTYTEQALLTQSDLALAEHRLIGSIPQVLTATANGSVDRGFVAIENAIEGTVNITLDTLAFDLDLLIQREVEMPISVNLLAPAGTRLADIERLVSIPVAAAQCRKFLAENLPDAALEAANSTAEGAQIVADRNDGVSATVGPARTAEVYGLDLLAAEIEDHPENRTRFVTVARQGIPARTGHDKTSIVVYQRADVPGSLLSILQEFAARSINLSKLESRPTKTQLGDYCFIIDLDGHIADEVVGEALRETHIKQGGVKFLGSYPAAGAREQEIRAEAGQAQHDADAWLDGLRHDIG
ncbi:MAG: prephenate dehydratase [Acidimicrobiales bacterium]